MEGQGEIIFGPLLQSHAESMKKRLEDVYNFSAK